MRKCLFIWAFATLFLISSGCLAEELVKASGDKVWGDTQKKWTYLEGNVRILQGSNQISTARAEINLDQKLLFLNGEVRLAHPEVNIAATKLDYDLRKKTGTFKELVVMERLIVKDAKGVTIKEPFKLICEELYFESETRNFSAKGKAQVEQKDFSGSADLIEYQDAKQELKFRGNAFLKRPAGEEIRGEEVVISLKDKSFLVRRQVTLEFKVEDDRTSGKPQPPVSP